LPSFGRKNNRKLYFNRKEVKEKVLRKVFAIFQGNLALAKQIELQFVIHLHLNAKLNMGS
jgi:hypothetical protein